MNILTLRIASFVWVILSQMTMNTLEQDIQTLFTHQEECDLSLTKQASNYYSITNTANNTRYLLSVSSFFYIPCLTDYRIFYTNNPRYSDYQKFLDLEDNMSNQSKSPFLERLR